MSRSVSVSYTHLDVYKRQVHAWDLSLSETSESNFLICWLIFFLSWRVHVHSSLKASLVYVSVVFEIIIRCLLQTIDLFFLPLLVALANKRKLNISVQTDRFCATYWLFRKATIVLESHNRTTYILSLIHI